MKIYMDNESKDFHKIITITSSYNIGIFDDLDTIVDALKSYGYTEESIKRGFLKKCLEWGIIKGITYD